MPSAVIDEVTLERFDEGGIIEGHGEVRASVLSVLALLRRRDERLELSAA